MNAVQINAIAHDIETAIKDHSRAVLSHGMSFRIVYARTSCRVLFQHNGETRAFTIDSDLYHAAAVSAFFKLYSIIHN